MTPSDLGSAPAEGDRLMEDSTEDAPGRMTFLEHLDELRRRLLYSVYAVAASCAVTFYFSNDMYGYMVRYFQDQGGSLIFSVPTAGFMFSLKIVLLAAILVASPFIFLQLWLFVAPGLYSREKRMAIPFVACSTLLFGLGAWFGHAVAFPSMWAFFESYAIQGLTFMPQLDITFGFYVKLILGLGIVFQEPILIFFLARFGIVSAGFLWRNFKYAVLIIVVLAAIITPSSDVVNLAVFSAPMLVLYLVSIGVAWVFGRKKPRETEGA